MANEDEKLRHYKARIDRKWNELSWQDDARNNFEDKYWEELSKVLKDVVAEEEKINSLLDKCNQKKSN